MKKITFICLLAIAGLGCKLTVPPKSQDVAIGMSESDFKRTNRYARLVYLSDDQTATYEIQRGTGELLTVSDFYYFKAGKLTKFEKKTHYFDRKTVVVENLKDLKN